MFVAFSRVCSSTVVVGALGPSSSSGIPYQCMRCSFIVPVLCLLFYTVALLSLQIAALDISFPLPPSLTAGFLVQGLFLFICFIYSFIYLCFPPLSHLALVWQRGLGARDLQLDCGLGRPVGCSSTLGCDCSCSSWAPWASSLHLLCGCKLDIKLFIYLFGIFIQAGSVRLLKAGLHCLYKW